MTDEEKKFKVKINVDKAKIKTTTAIVFIIISIITYVVPLIYGSFDFGIIFEIMSLIFLLIARSYMNKYDEIMSKKFIICSLVPIGWIFIYDVIRFLLLAIKNIESFFFLLESFFDGEILTFFYIGILFAIDTDLAKADNPDKYKESTDWFYEKYEGKKDEVKKNV